MLVNHCANAVCTFKGAAGEVGTGSPLLSCKGGLSFHGVVPGEVTQVSLTENGEKSTAYPSGFVQIDFGPVMGPYGSRRTSSRS